MCRLLLLSYSELALKIIYCRILIGNRQLSSWGFTWSIIAFQYNAGICNTLALQSYITLSQCIWLVSFGMTIITWAQYIALITATVLLSYMYCLSFILPLLMGAHIYCNTNDKTFTCTQFLLNFEHNGDFKRKKYIQEQYIKLTMIHRPQHVGLRANCIYIRWRKKCCQMLDS